MTPEAKVKKKVVAILNDHGAYYFYPVTGGYGRSGVPDIVACHGGRFIGIECKANGNVRLGRTNPQHCRRRTCRTSAVRVAKLWS